MCRDKGFDGVGPDDPENPENMDGHRNRTGFPLTARDRLRHNRLIARLAHGRGPAGGPKNDLDRIPRPVGDIDFAVDEPCAQYGECARLTPFVEAGKAVLHAGHELPADRFRAESRRLGPGSLLRKYEPGAWRRAC